MKRAIINSFISTEGHDYDEFSRVLGITIKNN